VANLHQTIEHRRSYAIGCTFCQGLSGIPLPQIARHFVGARKDFSAQPIRLME